jgi:hypothetical protein
MNYVKNPSPGEQANGRLANFVKSGSWFRENVNVIDRRLIEILESKGVSIDHDWIEYSDISEYEDTNSHCFDVLTSKSEFIYVEVVLSDDGGEVEEVIYRDVTASVDVRERVPGYALSDGYLKIKALRILNGAAN